MGRVCLIVLLPKLDPHLGILIEGVNDFTVSLTWIQKQNTLDWLNPASIATELQLFYFF